MRVLLAKESSIFIKRSLDFDLEDDAAAGDFDKKIAIMQRAGTGQALSIAKAMTNRTDFCGCAISALDRLCSSIMLIGKYFYHTNSFVYMT